MKSVEIQPKGSSNSRIVKVSSSLTLLPVDSDLIWPHFDLAELGEECGDPTQGSSNSRIGQVSSVLSSTLLPVDPDLTWPYFDLADLGEECGDPTQVSPHSRIAQVSFILTSSSLPIDPDLTWPHFDLGDLGDWTGELIAQVSSSFKFDLVACWPLPDLTLTWLTWETELVNELPK